MFFCLSVVWLHFFHLVLHFLWQKGFRILLCKLFLHGKIDLRRSLCILVCPVSSFIDNAIMRADRSKIFCLAVRTKIFWQETAYLTLSSQMNPPVVLRLFLERNSQISDCVQATPVLPPQKCKNSLITTKIDASCSTVLSLIPVIS